jgi:hypothetical protein
MNAIPALHAEMFPRLCLVLGGQHPAALDECIAARLLRPLFELAHELDLLPALAARCQERNIGPEALGDQRADALRQALMDNTLRNMKISAQAIKLTRVLNRVGITPLFMKGTARLLASPAGSLGFRKQLDIDLIVRPGQIEAAAEAFIADGYRFHGNSGIAGAQAATLDDTAVAIRSSAAHHHLSPLQKSGYAASVELHRHFLDRRFQRRNPLHLLFDNARRVEANDVAFQVASPEHQIIQLVLGTFVNDGHWARRTFPVREACDLVEIRAAAEDRIDRQFVLHACGRSYPLFEALVCALMKCGPVNSIHARDNVVKFTRMMDRRSGSLALRRLLDNYARAEYLAHALVYNPAKLPAYLRRQVASTEQ